LSDKRDYNILLIEERDASEGRRKKRRFRRRGMKRRNSEGMKGNIGALIRVFFFLG
jgi:hypothetical protein